jgi:isoleucyl-tRNA synthetase
VVACNERERAALDSLASVVAEELNVKKIEYVGSAGELVRYVIKPNFKTLGPKFGKNMPAVTKAVAALAADETGERLASSQSVAVKVGDHEHEFSPEDFVVQTQEREGYRVEREGPLAVAIATAVSPELRREGLARELVHHIQNTRKTADFRIDDRIHLRVWGPAEIMEMLTAHGEWVQKETLAVSLETVEANGVGGTAKKPKADSEPATEATSAMAHREELRVNGLPVTVEVSKARSA